MVILSLLFLRHILALISHTGFLDNGYV